MIRGREKPTRAIVWNINKDTFILSKWRAHESCATSRLPWLYQAPKKATKRRAMP
jgi:hypothetical protein